MSETSNTIRDVVSESIGVASPVRSIYFARRQQLRMVRVQQLVLLECVSKAQQVSNRCIATPRGHASVRQKACVRMPCGSSLFRIANTAVRHGLVFGL